MKQVDASESSGEVPEVVVGEMVMSPLMSASRFVGVTLVGKISRILSSIPKDAWIASQTRSRRAIPSCCSNVPPFRPEPRRIHFTRLVSSSDARLTSQESSAASCLLRTSFKEKKNLIECNHMSTFDLFR